MDASQSQGAARQTLTTTRWSGEFRAKYNGRCGLTGRTIFAGDPVRMVDFAGHAISEPGITSELVRATDSYAQKLT